MFQAILVPGHSAEGHTFSPIFQQRLDGAVRVARRLGVVVIIVSGRGSGERTEAEIGAEYLQRSDLPKHVTYVLLEKDSQETIGNYIFSTAAFIEPLRIDRIITVTSSDQANRCHKIAHHLWQGKVDHSVFIAASRKGDEVGDLEKGQFVDLERADFVAEFVREKRDELEGHLSWLREQHAKARKYRTAEDVKTEGIESLPPDLRKLVQLLEKSNSALAKWRRQWAEEMPVRRSLYRAIAACDNVSNVVGQAERLGVLWSIAELARLVEPPMSEITDDDVGALMHHVPLKLFLAFSSTGDLEKGNRLEVQRYARVMRACIEYLERLGRSDVTVWEGRGAKPRTRTESIEWFKSQLQSLAELGHSGS